MLRSHGYAFHDFCTFQKVRLSLVGERCSPGALPKSRDRCKTSFNGSAISVKIFLHPAQSQAKAAKSGLPVILFDRITLAVIRLA